jgi:hypothetical protein
MMIACEATNVQADIIGSGRAGVETSAFTSERSFNLWVPYVPHKL